MLYIIKLLRQHISLGQFLGFAFANLVGLFIVLLGIQFYTDINSALYSTNGVLSDNYIVVSKKISANTVISNKPISFSAKEILEIKDQEFVKSIGGFNSSKFEVSLSLMLPNTSNVSTALFFESVPNKYIDLESDKWQFNSDNPFIPIIIPRSYLNLYNFGFAQTQSLPKLSEQAISAVPLKVRIFANGKYEFFNAGIVGFSDRINTVLVPNEFLFWANNRFAKNQPVQPNRLIVEVENINDNKIAEFFSSKQYEIEGTALNNSQSAYILKIIVLIVLIIGLVICALSFYILFLSILLLIEKNNEKIENLFLIGYSQFKIALPYQILVIFVSLIVYILAIFSISIIRTYYITPIQQVLEQNFTNSSMLYSIVVGAIIFIAISILNIIIINRKIYSVINK